MLALDLYESMVCDGCGGYLPDTTAPEADEGYVKEPPIRCHRCTHIAIQAAAVQKDTPQPQALRFPARRKPTRGGAL